VAATHVELRLAMLTEDEVERIVERAIRRVMEEQPARAFAFRKTRHSLKTAAKRRS
jgi:hypothetical protein